MIPAAYNGMTVDMAAVGARLRLKGRPLNRDRETQSAHQVVQHMIVPPA
jgi:hypothetical protein